MIYRKPKNEDEQKKFHRESYEVEKDDLITLFKEQGYDTKYLNIFLTNSLKDCYETELKEDGIFEEVAS